jgi:hypothetical protein
MKRHSITDIIRKVQLLSISSDRFTNDFSKRTVSENADIHYCNLIRIRTAATNEIIRLQAKEEYADQVERLQQRLGERDMMDEICGSFKNTTP